MYFASRGSTVVLHSARHPKVNGLSTTPAVVTGRDKLIEKHFKSGFWLKQDIGGLSLKNVLMGPPQFMPFSRNRGRTAFFLRRWCSGQIS
jgi:hypothetical protein